MILVMQVKLPAKLANWLKHILLKALTTHTHTHTQIHQTGTCNGKVISNVFPY